jgi:hypothetical protein
MLKINRLLNTLPDANAGVSDRCRSLLERLYFALDAVTLTNLVILAIAVWQPALPAPL